MDVLDDKTVGELWQEKNRHSPDCVFTGKVEVLIHKLIEDRIRFYRVHYGWGPDYAKGAALDDFNIDPKTWHEG